MLRKFKENNDNSACMLYLETDKVITPISSVSDEDFCSEHAMIVLAPLSKTNTPAYTALSIARCLHALDRIPTGVKCILCIDSSFRKSSDHL